MPTTNRVWVLEIDHEHGTEVTVHHSHDDAKAFLDSHVTESWEPNGPPGPMPDSPRSRINAYFDVNADESYTIESATLVAPSGSLHLSDPSEDDGETLYTVLAGDKPVLGLIVTGSTVRVISWPDGEQAVEHGSATIA